MRDDDGYDFCTEEEENTDQDTEEVYKHQKRLLTLQTTSRYRYRFFILPNHQ